MKRFALPAPSFHLAVGERRTVPVVVFPFTTFHGLGYAGHRGLWELYLQWPPRKPSRPAWRGGVEHWRRLIVHEWLHMWFVESGARKWLARILPSALADDIEERLVELLEPTITKSLERHGFAFPEMPDKETDTP